MSAPHSIGLARNSDPETSHQAAKSVHTEPLEALLLAAYWAITYLTQ